MKTKSKSIRPFLMGLVFLVIALASAWHNKPVLMLFFAAIAVLMSIIAANMEIGRNKTHADRENKSVRDNLSNELKCWQDAFSAFTERFEPDQAIRLDYGLRYLLSLKEPSSVFDRQLLARLIPPDSGYKYLALTAVQVLRVEVQEELAQEIAICIGRNAHDQLATVTAAERSKSLRLDELKTAISAIHVTE